ncbi:AMSH-like ubiquitin thioesterase 3 isoform X2 [Nymphaea colorata]|uniref:AMSH-like ubiquitin thioesterase 3 isoform X2 n=1 Tax=Nymphaea colorata TaxID=210225 RepID=UPI00129EC5AD|nr:AMSH-like ubiquitin thioesterase 3 isoform X2 [Nymphaea colorata]
MANFLCSVAKVEVDNRLPISYYFRMASHMIKQAKVYRDEHNVVDLYVILLKYSSLVTETISQHQNYRHCSNTEKMHHKKVLKEFEKELAVLRPLVKQKLDGTNRHNTIEISKDKSGSGNSCLSHRRKDHSGFTGHSFKGEYPTRAGSFSHLNHRDGSDILINKLSTSRSHCSEESTSAEDAELASVVLVDTPSNNLLYEAPCLTSIAAGDHDINVHIVRQPRPSPVLSCIQRLPDAETKGNLQLTADDVSGSQGIKTVHISVRLVQDFLELARGNTENNLETCGVLGAFLANRMYYVTCLIIPKQKSTSDSCQTENEEEIYSIQDQQSLFPLGWIHTHPSQSCFMSSIDLHTHYSYQELWDFSTNRAYWDNSLEEVSGDGISRS